MQAELQLIEANKNATHKIFVNSQQELDNFSLEKYFDTIPEMLEQKHNILRIE